MKYFAGLLVSLIFSGKALAAGEDIVINVKDLTRSEKLWFTRPLKLFESDVQPQPVISKIQILSDSTYRLIISGITEPILSNCSGLNRPAFPAFISPGDQLSLIIQKDSISSTVKITFHGKNEGNYNFSTELSTLASGLKMFKRMQVVENDAQIIAVIDSNYAETCQRINAYCIKYPNEALRKMLLEEEDASRYYYLYFGVSELKKKNAAFNENDLVKKYFTKAIKNEDSILMFSRRYTYAMVKAVDVLMASNIQSYADQLLVRAATIKKNFTGILQEYLLSTLFYYQVKALASNGSNDVFVDEWYDKYAKDIHDPQYLFFIDYAYANYKKGNKVFPDSVLLNRIYAYDGTPGRLGDMLKKYAGKVILIDNWASWCGPCKEEMEYSKENVAKMTEMGIQLIYLSVDNEKDHEKMKAVADEFGFSDAVYRIADNFKSAYANYLDIKSIPRYVVLDKEGRIKKLNALRPSTPELLSELSTLK
ncbi:redoxin family protein [Chitinophaga sp. SYP-B3965]|uniref:TlpA family protein disulfide reductase n=1 Tax=Chitinophaga sp. SYP-B3965 TaxID=2663120 RepID=UPI001299FEC8|nr:TlpA disulfide reductase family protein [Chitinophaga sp. SYP-B3965]MRG46984.1 redoxin family protein [Chitinophaga sp. SYP-B3965]